MTSKIFCVVSNDDNLTGFSVDFNVALTVGDLKDAIRAERESRLAGLDAADLILVRVFKENVGGLTKKQLEQSKDALSLTNYGNYPEDPDIADDVSMFCSAPGACQMREGLTFKVMNSMEQVSVFTAYLPVQLYHVLVLVPPQKKKNRAPTIAEFLSNSLSTIEKRLNQASSSGTARSHPRALKNVQRWLDFKQSATSFPFPNSPSSRDIVLPATTELQFNSEKDVDKVVGTHLDNFNRIFRNLGFGCRFRSKSIFDDTSFIGIPDYVLIIDNRVIAFVENKTPNDLPVFHSQTNEPFDLLRMYLEDRNYTSSKTCRGDIGRSDVCSMIEQVYGYLVLNNLIYGCVTCYDVTYFLWRSEVGLLCISDPIYNDGMSPTLLQCFYYFSHLALEGHRTGQQRLHRNPTTDAPMDVDETEDDSNNEFFDDYSAATTPLTNQAAYQVNIDTINHGRVIGVGATGQVIQLKDSKIVLKHCDSHNNHDGFDMLKKEIAIYEYLSNLNLEFIPRYHGVCEFYGQYFLALDFIDGIHCDWRVDKILKRQLSKILRRLKSVGVFHDDLRPENVLLTPNGDIKLIDFGKARMVV
ncbi:UNVERIFIED_CONTAM: putative protein serine/threonine kinase [Siphonaria sp. JEL0065]|nr:putative protein serine/threonine kinase [Siphonaria sp. JEL0065]